MLKNVTFFYKSHYSRDLYTLTLSILFFVLFNCSAFSQAPNLKFKQIGVDYGLSNSWIETVFQDYRGFIWIATRDGLNRYDGQQIKVYRNNLKDTSTISDNFIRCIYEDRQHNLWIGTANGLNMLNRNTDSFMRYKYDKSNSKSLSFNTISCIYQDKKNNLWVCTSVGLNLFNMKTHTFERFLHDPANANTISSDNVNYVYQDVNDKIWFGTDAGLNLLNEKDHSFTLYHNSIPNIQSTLSNSIRIIQGDRNGNLWLGTNTGGVILFNPNKITYKLYSHQLNNKASLSGNEICGLLTDREGRLWIGVINEGLNLYEPATDSFIHYGHEFNNPYSIAQKTASWIYEDKQGNLWVGTHRGGVSLYAPNANRFDLYRQGENSNTISSSDVKSFCQDKKGNIWIGTDGGGMNLFDRKSNTFRRYQHDPKNIKSIGSDAVLDINQDSNGNIWVSTWSGGLNLFDAASGNFTSFKNSPADKNSISSDFVQKTYQDQQGNLWVGTYFGGLNLLNTKTHRFTRIITSPDGKSSLSGNNIVSIIGDKSGNVWFGTDDAGLNCYNLKTETFSHYFDHLERSPDIRVLFVDSKGRVWAGMKGMYLFNPSKNKFATYTNKAGLDNEYIKGITEDDNGNLWISTSNGLTRFNPETYSTQKFNIKDGLQGSEFESNAFLKASNGEMFFGGNNGLNTFFPNRVKTNEFIPPVYITDFQIFNKHIVVGQQDSPLKEDITVTKAITLSYNQSSISFDFAALNFVIAENNQYAYKLEGFDENWVIGNSQRKASYTNLDPGQYVFHVKASNNDGIWNENGSSITIIIKPPFWETWWFEILTVLVIVGGAYAYYRNRIDRIKEQKANLEKQVKERTAEVVLKAEELQGVNEELHAQSEELSKQAEDLKRLNAELAKQKEQELEKAVAQGKFEIASEVLHDIGNAMVGFGSYLNRINRTVEQNNVETIKSLVLFLKGQEEAIGSVIGKDKAAALVSITEGISKTQSTNQEEIGSSINELLNIVTHIQEILSIQSQFVRGHGGVHDRKPVNLINIIDDCKAMLFASFEKKGIQFKINIEPGSYIIKGDHTKLMQVLLNILKNSVEAIDMESVEKKISLSMQSVGKIIEISIQDNGQGFDEVTGHKLFERGFTTKKAGTGLGLYNCRSIVESHAGTFAITSDGPGKGATIKIGFAL